MKITTFRLKYENLGLVSCGHLANKEILQYTYNSNDNEFTGGRFIDKVAILVSSFHLVITKGCDDEVVVSVENRFLSINFDAVLVIELRHEWLLIRIIIVNG